jgi:hypothetical protein
MSDYAQKFIENLPPLLTIKKACEVLGNCCPATVYNKLGEGKFRAKKMGGRTLIDTQSLLDYVDTLPGAKIAPPGRPRKQSHEIAKTA